jgi:hypothetical protein
MRHEERSQISGRKKAKSANPVESGKFYVPRTGTDDASRTCCEREKEKGSTSGRRRGPSANDALLSLKVK